MNFKRECNPINHLNNLTEQIKKLETVSGPEQKNEVDRINKLETHSYRTKLMK